MIRRIKRKQAALNAQDEGADDDDARPRQSRQTQAVGSSPAGPVPARLKAEKMSQRQTSVVPDTQFEGVGDDDREDWI